MADGVALRLMGDWRLVETGWRIHDISGEAAVFESAQTARLRGLNGRGWYRYRQDGAVSGPYNDLILMQMGGKPWVVRA